uniref:hypothetical protein n=1 Tax=Staphylococcus epidermidis TaxID=1282 RepID=UPI001C92E274
LSTHLFKPIPKKTPQNILNTLPENPINHILTPPQILQTLPTLPNNKQNQIPHHINPNQQS